MTFSNDKPIYIQMADRLCDEILADKYHIKTTTVSRRSVNMPCCWR